MAKIRTKIKSDNVIGEILEILQREKVTSKASIEQRMHSVAARLGLTYRTQAVGFGLTTMKSLGWVTNDRGYWHITGEGMKARVTDELLKELARRPWPSPVNPSQTSKPVPVQANPVCLTAPAPQAIAAPSSKGQRLLP